MTETEWDWSEDPGAMLGEATAPYNSDLPRPGEKISDRKLRLFAVGCCRQVWHLLTDPRSRKAVEVAERFADGLATEEDLGDAFERGPADTDHTQDYMAMDLAWIACSSRQNQTSIADFFRASHPKEIDAAAASLLREIVGNPFRPVVLAPEEPADVFAALGVMGRELKRPERRYVKRGWLTSDAIAIATAIYADLDWPSLPILADALTDAGCDSEDLLGHLRSPGPHVRGCWALDLILGKS